VIKFFFIAALFLLSSCTTGVSNFTPIVQRLKDRGPVPVSPDNPYLAANLLLTKSKEQHSELKGFLDTQGYPPAIKVSSSIFKPLLITLYYPQNSECYIAELADTGSFINGPFSIEEEDSSALSKIRISIPKNISNTQAPSSKQSTKASQQKVVPKKTIAPLKQEVPTPVPTPDREAPKREENIIAPTTSDEQAEISPRGDVVHYVTDASETIQKISRWYTGEESNAEKILRLNNSETLSVGDAVIIPSYLVKQKARMPKF